MSGDSLKESLRNYDKTNKSGTKSKNNIIWGHFTTDDINRIILRCTVFLTQKELEKVIKIEMKPLELNYGVSVDELWKRIYEVNKAPIDNISIGGINYEKQIKRLLAGLAIPISIERDTLQK